MEAMNEILELHGVEYIEEIDTHYLNTGDPYDDTILFKDGEFTIGAWGDLVEGSHDAE